MDRPGRPPETTGRASGVMRGRGRAAILAGSAVALGCTVPLIAARPLDGTLAAGITVGYAVAAYGCVAGDRRLARWLLVGLLLWGGSLISGVRWATVADWACWAAFWVALAAGPAVLRCRAARREVAFPTLSSAVAVLLASAAAAGAAMAGSSWADGWWPGPAQDGWALAVQAACAAAAPLAVGIAAGRRRWARAGVSALLTQLATPPTVEGVQAVLREALGDPSAAVYYRLPDSSSLVSATGGLVDPGHSQPGRVLFPVTGHDGQPAALLSIDGSQGVDTSRVQAALTVCGPALENARLQAALRARLHDVSESRARIVQTAVAERRRLARDLHDGAQQHLLVLSTRLGLARQQATHPQSIAAIDAARDQLRVALSKLRGIGRDLHPAVLETEGLTAALESLADEGPLDIDLTGHVGRLSPEAVTVAYLSVREILDGLVQQAGATRARVTHAAHGNRLTITVSSDGRLGVKSGMPGWLAVITDRIRADGGDIGVRSDPGPVGTQGGVWVEAWIPCE